MPTSCADDANDAQYGVWEEMTLPGVDLATLRVMAMAINPRNPSIVYVGTQQEGIFRTQDCGASWVKVNIGRNGAELDTGRNWSMVIDPDEPETLYTVAGYGTAGVFKSTNGGVDWDQIISPDVLSAFIFGGFVQKIVMDPTDHLHLLVNPHFTCDTDRGFTAGCVAETRDGGQTWELIQNAQPSNEGGGYAMEDQDVWYASEGYGGLYRTQDRGATWQRVTSSQSYAYPSYFVQGQDDRRYLPAAFGIIVSTDGIHWQELENSPGATALLGTETTLFAARGSCPNLRSEEQLYYSSRSDPTDWTLVLAPEGMTEAGIYQMGYDEVCHFLYVTACSGGLWRIRLNPFPAD